MRKFVILAFLAVIFACAQGAAIEEQVAVEESVNNNNEEAATALLEVDAGAEHGNESPREARQFYGGGFYGRPYYGGGFYRPRPYYGGGFGGGYGGYPGYYGGYGGFRRPGFGFYG